MVSTAPSSNWRHDTITNTQCHGLRTSCWMYIFPRYSAMYLSAIFRDAGCTYVRVRYLHTVEFCRQGEGHRYITQGGHRYITQWICNTNNSPLVLLLCIFLLGIWRCLTSSTQSTNLTFHLFCRNSLRSLPTTRL